MYCDFFGSRIHYDWAMVEKENEMRLTEIKVEYVDEMPSFYKEGILYVSKIYRTALHLCCCGCLQKTVTPLNKNGWNLTEHGDDVISLSPSIGNFKGENPYHAHYFIRQNKIVWC